MNQVVAVGSMAVVATGMWLTTKHYRTRFHEFNETFRELVRTYFKGRTLTEQLNLTYLYLFDKAKFDQVLKDEHDKYFDKFINDNIWDSWLNTPLICYYLAQDYQYLSDPFYRETNSRKQVFGDKCNIKASDVKSDLSHLPEDVRDNFTRGSQVSHYFMHHGIKFEDMFDYNKIKDYIRQVTVLKCQTNDHDEEEYLSVVKTFIEQVRAVHFARQLDPDTNRLDPEIKNQDPILYYTIKLYYHVN